MDFLIGFLKDELLILSLELNLRCRARHAICSESISATSQSRFVCRRHNCVCVFCFRNLIFCNVRDCVRAATCLYTECILSRADRAFAGLMFSTEGPVVVGYFQQRDRWWSATFLFLCFLCVFSRGVTFGSQRLGSRDQTQNNIIFFSSLLFLVCQTPCTQS